ncbi:MAG TPA: hypothetical protein PKE51_13415 [Gemmatimonadaceae bacterium]|nr:hypothetical protein [Gemmatimonadaceae bacterium]
MADPDLASVYASLLRGRTNARADCPPLEAVQALAATDGHDPSRLEQLDHVMSCASCMGEYEMLRAVRVAGETPQATATRRSPLVLPAIGLLAASLLVFSVSRREPDADTDRVRGRTDAVEFVTPTTVVSRIDSLRLTWHAVPQASAYEVELLTPDGAVLFTTTTPDTTLRVAPDVVPANVSVVEWLVLARRADGNVLRSPLLRVELP